MLPAESVVTPFAASDPEPPYVCDVSVWADRDAAETTRNAQIEREENLGCTAQNSTKWWRTRCLQFITAAPRYSESVVGLLASAAECKGC